MLNNSGSALDNSLSWRKYINALCRDRSKAEVSDLLNLKKEIEFIYEKEVPEFLQFFIPWSTSALNAFPVDNETFFPAREAILDIYSLLPGLGEPLKIYLNDILTTLIKVLKDDNESNGLASMHIFMEFHKVYRGAVEGSVQDFIDHVLKLLNNFPDIAHASLLSLKNMGSDIRDSTTIPACRSVKVIIESPVMVVLLFQLHRKFINDNILLFVPLIVKILEISIPMPTFTFINDSKTFDDISSVSGQIKNQARQHYCDFIQAKVKVLSFLAYVSRSFSSALKTYQASIPLFIIDILKNCPPEAASARKELLVAVRHILATELRQAFVAQFENLLDEKLLFGVGYTSSNVMRPLVFSTIADLVHHIRLDLSPKMIIKVIDMYSHCFHDPTLPYGIQTMSAKLLLNLMDCVNNEKMNPDLRRPLSMKILSVFLRKYSSLAKVVAEINSRRFGSNLNAVILDKSFDIFWDDPLKCRTINSDSISADSGKDNIRDIKFILKTITAGIKSILLSFKTNYLSFNSENENLTLSQNTSVFLNSCNISLNESRLFVDMFKDGVSCFDICQSDLNYGTSAANSSITSISSEDKDLVDQFAYIFTLLDPYIFQDVISAHIEFLFQKIVKNPLLLIIPQYFLAINSVSRNFAGILIKFLMDKFELIGDNSIQGNALLRLFKLVFLAVSVYPDENEHMILSYISDIILNCLKFSPQSNYPINYFLVLKALFRGIAGGRFENLYKEVLPILPLLLETLNKLVTSTSDRQMRDLYVELCLTTPVRLSVLLPYLSFLMKPLVLSLNSDTELVNQGLRTLELCVDNLTQDFLEPILAPVFPELLKALWNLLRKGTNSNNSQSQFALRILGKFGGRGRRFLKFPLHLNYSESKDSSISLISYEATSPEQRLELPLDDLIVLCHEYFCSSHLHLSDNYNPTDLFGILLACLSSFCGFDILETQSFSLNNVSTFIQTSPEIEKNLLNDEVSVLSRLKNQRKIEVTSTNANNSTDNSNLKKLLVTLFNVSIAENNELADRATICLNNICDRFVIFQTLSLKNHAKDYSFLGLTPNILLEVIAEQITGPNDLLVGKALALLARIYDILKNQISFEKIADLPLYFLLVEKLISYCYGSEFYRKMGSCLGIKTLCDLNLGFRWMWIQESRIVRGLLYVLKDMPAYMSESQINLVSNTILAILSLCHSDKTFEDMDLKTKHQYYFNQIMSILISELTNSNFVVRAVIHQSFELLSKCNDCTVTELLSPHRDRLLTPIFTKPLRALPFSLQIGYVDAVNYCLNLKPPLVSFSEELLRLLHEALALVEADDTALVSKSAQLKNASNLVNLRVVCISLLSTAISCSEFQDPKMNQIRNHVVSAFFKSLYSKSPEIVTVARKGLELVILHQQKLPKDLLQHGLRPVLINLAEAKRLTLSGLEGLSKVLQLLTSYFKAEIGKKLLDHLNIWADQKLLEDLSSKPLLESTEVKIIVAILDIFHLLPPAANLFLDDLISMATKLDSWTKRTISSPFRPPLSKFLFKHVADSVAFLLKHPNCDYYVDLYENSMNSQQDCILIHELNKPDNMRVYLETFILKRDGHSRIVRVATLKILLKIVESIKKQFSLPDILKTGLKKIISGIANAEEFNETISNPREENELVLELVFSYLSVFIEDTDILFTLITSLDSSSSYLDLTWAPKYIRKICSNGLIHKQLLLEGINLISSSELSFSSKALIIRLVLLPIIFFIKNSEKTIVNIAGVNFLQKLEKNVLNRKISDINSLSESLSLEELQLVCAVLSSESSSELNKLSQSLRYFFICRNFSPDPVIRYSALFATCYYICEMGLDIHDLDSIIKSALNIPTSEVRPLLKQTLTYTIPCLLKQASSAYLNIWLQNIIADISKNNHFLTVISVFWSNFVNIENDLFEYRDVLIRPLISCFSKASLSVLAVHENRGIPFDVARIISNWMKTIIKPLEDGFVDQFLHTIIKMIMVFTDNSSESKSFISDGLALLQNISNFLYSNDLTVKLRFEYFIRCVPPSIEVSEDSINTSILFVKILKIVSITRDDAHFISDCIILQRFIHFCLTSCNEKLVFEICPLFARVCKFGLNNNFDELFAALQLYLYESLQGSRSLDCVLIVLETMFSNGAAITDNIILSFFKMYQKACSEYISHFDQSGNSTIDESSISIKSILIPAMKFSLSIICHSLGSSSKALVYALFKVIWENTTNSDMFAYILETCKLWFAEGADFSDFKEKSEIISAPNKIFFIQNELLMEKYLDLVLIIYSSPRLRSTDLTIKLEGSFLFGLCYSKKEIRHRFFYLIDEIIPRKIDLRVLFIFSSQRWNLVSNTYWIAFATSFILAAWPRELKQVSCLSWPSISSPLFSPTTLFSDKVDKILNTISDYAHFSNEICHSIWLRIFPQIWSFISSSSREELTHNIVKVISDPDFYISNLTLPNSIKTILDGLASLSDPPEISSDLISYAGSQFGAWYSACVFIESKLAATKKTSKCHDFSLIKDVCQLYNRLGETEMSSGLIRRYSIFPETNIALSFEQNCQWITAQKIFEKAQVKARSGAIPFFEDEYFVWECHWEQCAKRLQQWDLLAEVAKVDNNTNLSLECEWVLNDWSRNETKTHIEGLLCQVKEDTSQKKLMESFIALNQLKESADKVAVFQNSMDNLTQDVISQWSRLPEYPTRAHNSALEQLQIIVEVQESQSFFSNASNSMNRPQFLQELKALLSTWRDRLPNNWEDTSVWSGLLAWRQHVFTAINAVFHQAHATQNQSNPPETAGTSAATHPFAYRGYHETAWLINRFAHVARKNGMFDVSLSFLNKIYTLPNIEIQDAFLKLREQAKCYMESPNELPTALEVINATNLNYFNNSQKAEFFTLKAIVLSRLGMIDEANRIFAQAVQIDLNIAKGWSSWGYFNDQRFQQSKDITFGVNAVNCYLQAATLCKNSSSRKYLTRVLWLLSFEDSTGSMSKSFELYNNDLPSWYWVSFIPELLASLSRREARQARFLLMKIAKSYPQALYLQLRTTNEEFKILNASSATFSSPVQVESSDVKFFSQSPNTTIFTDSASIQAYSSSSNDKGHVSEGVDADSNNQDQTFMKKPPHEHTEDLLGILKTGYPLLALSLENMVEHIIHRLRSSPEEDLYRIITTLISENMQQTMIKLNANLSDQSLSPISAVEASLKKVADMLSSSAYLTQKFRQSFENDFLCGELTLTEIMCRLLKWRRQLGNVLDMLPSNFHLENFSRYLAEFEHQRYDEIDVPGQYLMLRDSSSDFVKLDRFDSQVEIIRRHGTSFRRIVMLGNDSSRNSFIVQNPSSRQSRREERVIQFLRMADAIIDKKIISKRLSLSFSIQLIVPLSSFVRLVQDDSGFTSLEDIFEQHCRRINILPEDPILYFRDCMFKGIESLNIPFKKGSVDLLNLRVDLFEEISQKFIPSNIITKYMKSIYSDFSAFWNFRRKFTSQYASFVFMTYVLAIGHRFPHKIGFNRATAEFITSDLLPSLNQNGQFTLTEAVPFRLTPNVQNFITEAGIEGPFSSSIFALGQALSGKKQDLSDYLTLYIRDEVLSWISSNSNHSNMSNGSEDHLNMHSEITSKILQNVEIIMKRVQSLGCNKELEKAADSLQPLDQTILDLIACATNPQKLAHMDSHWHPWL